MQLFYIGEVLLKVFFIIYSLRKNRNIYKHKYARAVKYSVVSKNDMHFIISRSSQLGIIFTDLANQSSNIFCVLTFFSVIIKNLFFFFSCWFLKSNFFHVLTLLFCRKKNVTVFPCSCLEVQLVPLLSIL